MKSLMSNLLLVVTLLLIGVACTTTPAPTPGEDPVVETAKLSIAACELLPAEGGECSLAYTIENPVEGAELIFGESSAEWLHDVVLSDDSHITFVYDENSDMPGSEPREASFTVTYADLDPISVVVKQASYEAEFTVTFTNATPTSVDVTCVAKDPEMRFVVGKLSGASLSEFESKEAWAEYYVTDRLAHWYENYTFQGSFPTEGINNTFNFYSYDMPAYVVVFGFSYTGEWENVEVATQVYLFEPPLLPTPVMNFDATEKSVLAAAGEISFDYTLENPIDGQQIAVETSAEWLTATLTSDSVVLSYEANTTAKERTATLTCSYMGAEDVTLELKQSGDTEAEPITFELTVLESHYDYILVDITPSDTNTKYAVGTILKSDFEDYPYYGSDEALMQDLVSSYNKPTIISGVQTNYAVSVGASDYTGWQWYVFVYAVDEAENVATSALVKTLVDVVDDTPILEFEVKKLNVPAEGGVFTVKYTLTNGREGGVVRFNGSPMNYYEVLKPNSWSIDTDKCEVTFEVNTYDELLFSHDATIFIAYYATADSEYSDATASLRIEQDAPVQ